MNTPLIDQGQKRDRPGSPHTTGPKSRTGIVALVAAALVVVAAIAVLASRESDSALSPELAAGPLLELSLGESNTLASCMPLTADLVASMSPAFAGTVTSVETTAETSTSTIMIDVDRWYAGGDAATVELNSQSGMEALIGGVEFLVGERYIITAANGVVNFCGASGPATAELTAIFEDAFAV